MMKQRPKRSLRKRAGYTLIEVMMSMGVFAVGAVGIMGLHQASTVANLEARQMSTATNILRTWMERMKRDALLWNVGGNGAAAADLTQTAYLQQVGNGWVVPVPTDTTESAAFNHFGLDTAVAGQMRFCTNVRLVWVSPGQALRTEVRVWWVRRGVDATPYAGCAAGTDPNTLTGNADLHFISAANVVRWTPL